jgi:alkanesulfonate monooxygenase SsuD/methylene tetrahydromethanopterin reductase-like flavin-dependent oxidoreductase (luciferase family)
MTLHLTLSLAAGGYHPGAPSPATPDAAALRAMARAAELAKLDAVLLGMPIPGCRKTMQLDPLPLLGSMIGITQRIGLAASWTIDFTEPFHVARVFATLDHLCYGRTAWFADMFDTEPLLPLIGKPRETADLATYCERAGEFIAVVKQLWDSWEDEGFALDKASGMFADPDHVHPINHVGRFFNVRGPLNVPRPPQGMPPLLLHDPADAPSRRFVATTADIVLTDSVTLERYRELRTLAAGRDIRVLTNLLCILGETEAAAQERAAALDSPAPSSGCARFVGTPAQLVALFADCACDGFNLLPAVVPNDVELLLDGAIPLAQRAGLVRLDYAGNTLREHLGLRRPRSQYAAERID